MPKNGPRPPPAATRSRDGHGLIERVTTTTALAAIRRSSNPIRPATTAFVVVCIDLYPGGALERDETPLSGGSVRLLRKVITAELVAIGLMLYAVNYAELKDNGREPLGVICVLLNIASIGAPLIQIGEVIRTKNSESMPLPLCLACFAVSLQWLCYGILVKDFFIQVKQFYCTESAPHHTYLCSFKAPNYVATLLSTIQLSLFVIYPRRPTFVQLKDDRDSI
ncbi:mtN3/saliva family protein [Ancylostoma ceylanicum]|uniref:Sugar transporter SWEET n=1 Tax=Ancylostoma ceylanicum TaxID=53326 RepID=A0A0D6LT05_9BILA|nr:mtN3/saliva family protein [Ancylostoma ceylanicum]